MVRVPVVVSRRGACFDTTAVARRAATIGWRQRVILPGGCWFRAGIRRLAGNLARVTAGHTRVSGGAAFGQEAPDVRRAYVGSVLAAFDPGDHRGGGTHPLGEVLLGQPETGPAHDDDPGDLFEGTKVFVCGRCGISSVSRLSRAI